MTAHDTAKNIEKGDAIKDVYGKTGVVIEVNGTMLWTTINCGAWVHISKCWKV